MTETHDVEPGWLGSMIRELTAARTRKLMMNWPCRMYTTSGESPNRKAIRESLNMIFSGFENQSFSGTPIDLPDTEDSDCGLPKPSELDDLVESFESLIDAALRLGWGIEVAISYDDIGRPMYNIVGVGMSSEGEVTSVNMFMVRYYLIDAIKHALVEIEKFLPRS